MSETINVGISEFRICTAPDKIMTVALGSCIGLVLYSYFSNTCGMIHIMMPNNPGEDKNIYKYADSGIKNMIDELSKHGVRRATLKAKMCGGARMFETTNDRMAIGDRNIEAVKKNLEKYRIEIIASDVGGSKSRTVTFDPSTKDMTVKIPGMNTYII